MKDLIKNIVIFILHIRNRCLIKSAKPSADLENKIIEARSRFFDQVTLLRLSHVELTRKSKDLRFDILQELINDIARSSK